jgi:hypothetical protein
MVFLLGKPSGKGYRKERLPASLRQALPERVFGGCTGDKGIRKMKKLTVSVFVFVYFFLSGPFSVGSLHAQQQLLFSKGVVTTGGCEQSSKAITVTPGTNVQYCYRLQNPTQEPYFVTATITDDKLGPVGGNPTFAGPLQAGQFELFVLTTSIVAPTVNTAHVTATIDTGSVTGTLVTTTDTATVNVQQGSAVPAFSEWGLVLFMLLMVSISIYTLRKQRA